MWAKDIEAAYPRMCAAHRWHVHKWNQTGKHFRELLGCGIKYGNHIDDGGVKHRWCYYPLPPPQALNGLLSRLAHDDGAGAPERAAA